MSSGGWKHHSVTYQNGEIPYQLGTSYEFSGIIHYSSADVTLLPLG